MKNLCGYCRYYIISSLENMEYGDCLKTKEYHHSLKKFSMFACTEFEERDKCDCCNQYIFEIKGATP